MERRPRLTYRLSARRRSRQGAVTQITLTLSLVRIISRALPSCMPRMSNRKQPLPSSNRCTTLLMRLHTPTPAIRRPTRINTS